MFTFFIINDYLFYLANIFYLKNHWILVYQNCLRMINDLEQKSIFEHYLRDIWFFCEYCQWKHSFPFFIVSRISICPTFTDPRNRQAHTLPTHLKPIWNPSLKQIPWLLVLFYGFLELMWVIKISSTIRSFSIVFVKVNKSFHRISRLQIVYG